MANYLTKPTPAVSPTLLGLTSDDAARIAAAIDAELADSSRESYASAWRQWEVWCSERGVSALPAAPELLAAFPTERAETGRCFGTLDGYCAGIAYWHCKANLPDPTADVLVRRVRRGLRRIPGVRPVVRHTR